MFPDMDVRDNRSAGGMGGLRVINISYTMAKLAIGPRLCPALSAMPVLDDAARRRLISASRRRRSSITGRPGATSFSHISPSLRWGTVLFLENTREASLERYAPPAFAERMLAFLGPWSRRRVRRERPPIPSVRAHAGTALSARRGSCDRAGAGLAGVVEEDGAAGCERPGASPHSGLLCAAHTGSRSPRQRSRPDTLDIVQPHGPACPPLARRPARQGALRATAAIVRAGGSGGRSGTRGGGGVQGASAAPAVAGRGIETHGGSCAKHAAGGDRRELPDAGRGASARLCGETAAVYGFETAK